MTTRIAENLRILMTQKGVSANQIETETEGVIKQPTLSRILHGQRNPRPNTLKNIADYFGITIGQLLGEEPLTELNLNEYPAGPLPEGCDPNLWARVPEKIDTMHLETLAPFAELFVREASLDDPFDQMMLKQIYCMWLKNKTEETMRKKSIPVAPNKKYR